MNNENTRRGGSAAHRRGPSLSKLQQEVAELAAQKAAISEVLRAIASSPHDLQPIFQSIIDSALRLCRGDGGNFRLVEEAGLRLVAYSLSRGGFKDYSPPMLLEHGSFLGRQIASKSPVQIPDIATTSAGDANLMALVEAGFRTVLLVPMLRNDDLVGSFSIGRRRIEHFRENEIELVTDFAAQAAIALEITRRERQLRELQMELAHVNRVATIGHLTASITHEVNQPLAAARNNLTAALNFVDRTPPDLVEVREALACALKDSDRASTVVGRIRALMQKAPERTDRVDINEALREVIELTQGEALKNGVSVKTKFAKGLPIITGDRVQLQQVVLNLILNALQAMGTVSEDARQMLITTSQTELNDLCIGVQDTGPGLSPENLSRLFEPFYTTKPNGMGMGLAICRSIVEAHGGPASYVKPYVKRGKTDAIDAEAICEAVSRPTMRFVPIKTVDCQAGVMLLKTRHLLVKQRTQAINSLRGHLSELGIIAARGTGKVETLIAIIRDKTDQRIPAVARRALEMLADQVEALARRIATLENEIVAEVRRDDTMRRLATIPGVGPITAATIVALVPDPRAFTSGRHFAAWIGLTPKMHSTGGKERLGRISKMGNPVLRSLLVVGATAVSRHARRGATVSPWLTGLLARRPAKVAAIALVNKMARIVWALLTKGGVFTRRPATARSMQPDLNMT